jgi:hypothetical protein
MCIHICKNLFTPSTPYDDKNRQQNNEYELLLVHCGFYYMLGNTIK